MPSIKQDMLHGVFWSAVEKYSGLVVSIAVSMVLARILSPAEYGVVAIATVIISFLNIFCTLGIGPAVIQKKDLTDKDIDSIFTFSLCIGIVMSVLFFCSSWFIARFYGNHLLVPICQILSIQVFFASANMVPNALMSKNKRFKEIARRTLTLQITSGVISIIAAFKGAGAYSLLISPVITSIGIFIWNRMYYRVHMDWKFNLEPVKRIFSFSSYQFLFSLVNYFSRNLDNLIIGKSMSVDALGVYEKAYRLMSTPLQNVTHVITPVLQPVLSDLQDDKYDLSQKYAKIIKFIASLSFPLGIILSGMSSEVIRLLYGGNWDGAIPVFRILALSLPLQMILSTSGSIFMAGNDTKEMFRSGLINTATTVMGFLIAAFVFNTLEAMAWAWTITNAINFCVTYYFLYGRVLKTSIVPMLKELIHPAICAFLVFILLYLENTLITLDNLLVLAIIKGCSSSLLAVLYTQLSGQYDIIGFIKSNFSKKTKNIL